MKKIGRNDPCPCGSGNKFKKCCLPKGAKAGYTRGERESVLAKLDHFIEKELDVPATSRNWSTVTKIADLMS